MYNPGLLGQYKYVTYVQEIEASLIETSLYSAGIIGVSLILALMILVLYLRTHF